MLISLLWFVIHWNVLRSFSAFSSFPYCFFLSFNCSWKVFRSSVFDFFFRFFIFYFGVCLFICSFNLSFFCSFLVSSPFCWFFLCVFFTFQILCLWFFPLLSFAAAAASICTSPKNDLTPTHWIGQRRNWRNRKKKICLMNYEAYKKKNAKKR